MAHSAVNRGTALLIAAVAAAGAGVIGGAAARWQGEDIGLVLTLAAFATLAERFDISLSRHTSLSVSAAAIMAAGSVAGLTGVMVVALAAALADFPGRNKPYYKAVFNAGALLVAGAAYVGVYESFPLGSDGQWPALLLPVLVGAMANFLVNSTLVALAVGTSNGERVVSVWRQNFSAVAAHYILLGVLAAVMVSAYDLEGLPVLAATLVPLAFMRFIMKQALARQPATAASG